MALILSEHKLSNPLSGDHPSSTSYPLDHYELAIQSSTSKSRGYLRLISLRYGLNLLIRDYWLQDVLIEEMLPHPAGLELEFGFNLVGVRSDDQPSGVNSCGFLQFGQTRTSACLQEWQPSGRLLKIDLHLVSHNNAQRFGDDQLDLIPAELRDAITNREPDWYTSLGAISPATQLVLQQILNCPYQGSIQQIYLEAKALELIALQSAQFLKHHAAEPQRYRLKPSDIERIHQAKALITHQLDNPPSLLDLARSVGLNDCTLKRGFRQVFGTTVFGYIRQRRLAKARQLLLDREMSVAEVACSVGYSHPGHFAAAFKREFGVSPKAYSNSGS
jgi:AraC family transcriptional regulator, transcriptional activator of the genes for pyochelin and ferripyochelin receptors